MSGFDGIKGHKSFAASRSNTTDRFERLVKEERPSVTRFAGRFAAGGMVAFGAASCAPHQSPFIADGNPAQVGGVVQPATPVEPPFIADGNPLQGGGPFRLFKMERLSHSHRSRSRLNRH